MLTSNCYRASYVHPEHGPTSLDIDGNSRLSSTISLNSFRASRDCKGCTMTCRIIKRRHVCVSWAAFFLDVMAGFWMHIARILQGRTGLGHSLVYGSRMCQRGTNCLKLNFQAPKPRDSRDRKGRVIELVSDSTALEPLCTSLWPAPPIATQVPGHSKSALNLLQRSNYVHRWAKARNLTWVFLEATWVVNSSCLEALTTLLHLRRSSQSEGVVAPSSHRKPRRPRAQYYPQPYTPHTLKIRTKQGLNRGFWSLFQP